MPREQPITITQGGVKREYRVVYGDDPPGRAEAVRFFQEHAECLFPSLAIPPKVEKMPIKEANAYFRRHPIKEQWSLLTIGRPSPIRDEELARLRHLPEISHVKGFSDQVTDAGVKHLLLLGGLTHLVLYSSRITDECLTYIRELRSLVSLDIQAAPNVSREAVLATINAMPWLQDAWPLPDPARLAECQRRSRLSQVARSGPPAVHAPTEPPGPAEPLRNVDLSWRPLARPPDDLFNKDDIKRLDLINCGVEVLPDSIGNLTRLRTLYANWGRLTELPDTISRLTTLEALWLNDNRLARLPDSFRRLTALKKLALDNNRLEQFPEAILGMKQLEELRPTGNRIPMLPDGIGNLTQLRSLSLSLGRNNLQTLPRNIGRLEKLTYLGLQGNPIRSLPEEVWRLPCLVTLNLAHTGFTKLPPEAANIPNIIGLPGQRVHS